MTLNFDFDILEVLKSSIWKLKNLLRTKVFSTSMKSEPARTASKYTFTVTFSFISLQEDLLKLALTKAILCMLM